MSVLKRWLWAACDVGLGRSYGRTGDSTQDCIRFQVAKVGVAYPDADLEPWTALLHLNVPDAIGSTASIAKYVELGIAEAWEGEPTKAGVYLCQGWRGTRGHAFDLIRRKDGLWLMDAAPATTDWLRPIEWDAIAKAWPTLAICRLV